MAAKTDKKSTSILSRTVNNIKKHRKAKNFIRVEQKEKPEVQQKVKKTRKIKTVKKRGMIYVAHLPAGFYENELQNYFNQFGRVTNVRLERSKKTGRSKGYAFVEFESSAVAKIAAETMNNYIMFNRILKAEFVTRKYNCKEFWKKTVDAKHYPKSERVKQNVLDWVLHDWKKELLQLNSLFTIFFTKQV
ncbi:RNA-binding protein 8A [Gryllus bimaculatus]|nr:RNA-binding protein 8A [Gryllus bimaculatus]